MNKLKIISWLVVTFVGLFLVYPATANEHYGEWEIEKNLGNQVYLSMKNENKEKIKIVCGSNMYLTSVALPYQIKGSDDFFFDYRVDNYSVILEGYNYSITWLIPSVRYDVIKGEVSGQVDKYKTLFQQMLKAKESITIDAIDEQGKIYHSISFSAKGLPEALIEFAKQCGTDFQTYSGIKVNQQDNNE